MRNLRVVYLISAALLALAGCQNKAPQEAASASQPEGKPPSLIERMMPESTMEVPAGTVLEVRLDEAVSTRTDGSGDKFTATLISPIVVGDKVAVPKGARVTGHVTNAGSSGRLRGRARLALTLDTLEVNGQSYRIDTSSTSRVSGSHKKRNAVLIGGGSGVGALIGGLAGGGVGALIGAGAGAAAGTAGAALTGRKNVAVPAEALLRFSLKEPVQVKG